MTARVTDVNGYTTIPRNPISRVGVFPYSGRSIRAPSDQADRIFQVYRPESELSDPETLESFKLAPWTDDHAMLGNPAVSEGLTNPEDKGAHGTLGEQVEYDPTTRTLYANLRLWSTKLGQLIDAGKKELSCGFRCMYEMTSGIFEGQPYDAIQRNIRGNHLASVEAGRMGPGVAVLDSLVFTFDAREATMKTTRRVKTAKLLGVAVDALPAYFGMDKADAAALKIWNTAMDAEDDAAPAEGGAKPSVTLEEVAAMLESVGPALAAINSAAAAIAGGAATTPAEQIDDMEPVLDAAGGQIVDPATGKPKMQKKVAAVAPAADANPAIAAMDSALGVLKTHAAAIRKMVPTGAVAPAALVALDADITKTEKTLAALRAPKIARTPAMDAIEARMAAAEKTIAESTGAGQMKKFMAEVTARDGLYKRASAFVGAFDHAEMTTVEVAKYAADKLGLKVAAGSEVVAVESYLHGRVAAPAASVGGGFGLDAAPATASADVTDYLAGKVSKAA